MKSTAKSAARKRGAQDAGLITIRSPTLCEIYLMSLAFDTLLGAPYELHHATCSKYNAQRHIEHLAYAKDRDRRRSSRR